MAQTIDLAVRGPSAAHFPFCHGTHMRLCRPQVIILTLAIIFKEKMYVTFCLIFFGFFLCVASF
jgi:hypothetical protein